MSRVDRGSVAVVGGGLMGAGIAQAVAAAGRSVVVTDPVPEALESLPGRIAASVELLGGDPGPLIGRIGASASLAEAVATAEIVIEAAPEDLELKRRIFAEIDAVAADGAILATNTSVISIGEIARAVARPQRVVGTHWWNPAPLIPLVEVIEAEDTGAETVSATIAFLESIGKSPVHIRRDIPGFVGNRLQHALWREALALVDEGVCDAETVDLVVREGFGRRLAVLGPIENADLIGLDLTEAIHSYLLPHLDRSVAPAAGLRRRVAAGELGARSGHGYLDWKSGDVERAQERLYGALARSVA